MGITMATEEEAVSLANKFTMDRGNTDLYCPRKAKDLGHDSHLINPLIRLSLRRFDMISTELKFVS
jgi:hypothetical protein